MLNNIVIFHNRDKICELTKKYYNKDLNCTGKEIISSYPFDLDDFELDFDDMLYFHDYYFIQCSKETKQVLDSKFKFDDFEARVSDDSEEMSYLIKRANNLSLITILNKIYDLNLSERIELSTDYDSIFMLHLSIYDKKIENILYDEIPNNVNDKDDFYNMNYIDEEYDLRFKLHTIYKLSYNEPISDTLDVLNIR